MSITQSPDSVYRDFESDGLPASGPWQPRKVEIRRLLNEHQQSIIALIAGAGEGLTLPNLLIRYSITTGDENDIEAEPNLPVIEGSGLSLFSIVIEQENTGPVTINGKPLLLRSGLEIPAGYLTPGPVLFMDAGAQFTLLSYGDAEAVQAAAEEFANLARAWAEGTEPAGVDTFSAREYSEKSGLWAEEAEDVPVEPGLFSAHHWALKAAAEFAAGVESSEVSMVRRSFVATSGQTVFAGSDESGLVLTYTTGNEVVTLNGVQLARGADYTATDGSTITLSEGAVATSRLVVVSFLPFTVADAWTKAESYSKPEVDVIAGAGMRLRGAPIRITSSGSYSTPAGVKALLIEAVGGGGSGGGAASSGTVARAGSGGGGAQCKRHFITSLSSSYVVTIGTGGAPGAAGDVNGNAGGATSFGSVVAAQGGGAGPSSGTSAGDIVIGGNSGAASGGTGGNIDDRPGMRGEGSLKLSGSIRRSGKGGDSPYGAGGNSSSFISNGANGAGAAGGGFGAGGAGGTSSTTVDQAGGAGSPGLVIVWEYI